MGDPITQGGIITIVIGMAIKEAFRWKSSRNGSRLLREDTFLRHGNKVEQMMSDDPPRKHTELLQDLVRETKENGRKLENICHNIKPPPQ